ncbi:hypothetical protein AeMF1_014487 [Aphanomyces euteiches]|nr:hypothetical protein AeMF1_014487 [Aphanomyces euteiches]KAH9196824.1 hypothetical protein AeNC1_001205 [Aphanomyces euteiches]
MLLAPRFSTVSFLWLLLVVAVQVYGVCEYCKVNQFPVLISIEGSNHNGTNTLGFKSSIVTSDNALRLQMQEDGNLVLVDLRGSKPLPIWASMKFVKKGKTAEAVLDENGRLVVYNNFKNLPIWSSDFYPSFRTIQPFCVWVRSDQKHFGVSIMDSGCQLVWRAPLPSTKKEFQAFEAMWNAYNETSDF